MHISEKAGGAVSDFLRENKNISILFLVSGGSSLEILEYISPHDLGPHITISVVDERYDAKNSNFQALTEKNFYTSAKEKNCGFIDTRIKGGETKESLAQRFETELRAWKKNHANGMVIAILGMGENGHTAGIMPYPENPSFFEKTFVETDKWVQSYDTGEKNPIPHRITTTIPFLTKETDEIVFYACGEAKKEAFRRVFATEGTLAQTPARVINSTKARVQVFTDIQGI